MLKLSCSVANKAALHIYLMMAQHSLGLIRHKRVVALIPLTKATCEVEVSH